MSATNNTNVGRGIYRNCTQITDFCIVEGTTYGYYPNLAANALFIAIFAILTLAHIPLSIKYKLWGYSFAVGAESDAFLSAAFQHVGSRFTQPGDQENNPRTFTPGFTFGGAPATATNVLDLELPDYQLVNLSAGVTLPNRIGLSIYVNNLLDENALLAFDRERGGRARLGFSVNQPRTIGAEPSACS